MKRTISAALLRNPIMFSVAALLGTIMLASVQSSAQSRYSHPSDLNSTNEFQGGIRQYLACSQTHFDAGDARQRELTRSYHFIRDSVSTGVQDINDNPPTPNTLSGAKVKLTAFLRFLKLLDTVILVDQIIDELNDEYIVRPAWWSQNDEWYEGEKVKIDEQVKERLRECARLQVEFNLGGGTAIWGGNRSWDIYYTSIGSGGAVVFSLPRLRQGIVTVHQVTNGN